MSKESVSHIGRIVEITPEFTSVEIVSESACAACHASALCGLSEYTHKAVQVPTRGWDNFTVGQEVNVVLKASMGHKAVILAYVLPLVVLVAALLGALSLGTHELVAGLIGLGAAGVYYVALWFFRDSLRNEYAFTIEEINKL